MLTHLAVAIVIALSSLITLKEKHCDGFLRLQNAEGGHHRCELVVSHSHSNSSLTKLHKKSCKIVVLIVQLTAKC